MAALMFISLTAGIFLTIPEAIKCYKSSIREKLDEEGVLQLYNELKKTDMYHSSKRKRNTQELENPEVTSFLRCVKKKKIGRKSAKKIKSGRKSE